MAVAVTKESPTGHTGPAEAIRPSRVRTAVIVVAVVIGVITVVGSFGGEGIGSIAYVAALCASALVLLLVAMQHPRHGRAWRLIGFGATVWAAAGILVVLQGDAQVESIPTLAISICYAAGYLPILVGLAELADTRLRSRRFTSMVDGVILFLALYAVLWLLVVEHVSGDASLDKLDRAFSALYPAGDLAVVMMAVRVVASRTARRRVGALLLGGAVGMAVADVSLMVLYLSDPYGAFPFTDLLYLGGLGCFAVAAVWALLPAPPPASVAGIASRHLPLVVAVSSLVPPVLLACIVLFSDRQIAVGPIALWLFLAVGAAVARQVAGVGELERAHQQSMWLASHDLDTSMLRRATFLHEVAEGSLRHRSGTVMVIELQGLTQLADERGHDTVEAVISTVGSRVLTVTGDAAVLARLSHDQFAVFLRSTGLARGRQVAGSLQVALAEPVSCAGKSVAVNAVMGVAQADGAVIDVLGGVRRATEALRHARLQGAGGIAVDAEITGTVMTGQPGVTDAQATRRLRTVPRTSAPGSTTTGSTPVTGPVTAPTPAVL